MESSDTLSKLPQVIEAATRCFQDKGYVATTLNDIADAVQLQKPTLYHYVKNKNELLFLVLKNTAESYNQALESVVSSGASPWEKMDRAIKQHIHLQLEHPGTVTLFRDLGELDSPYRREIRHALKRYRELLQEIIRAGIDGGQFRAQDASMAALFVLGAINFVHRWYRPEGPRTIGQIAAFYSHMILASLSHGGGDL